MLSYFNYQGKSVVRVSMGELTCDSSREWLNTSSVCASVI